MQAYHQRARGKLLLTSEYFILSGANAIVLPTRFGQTLTVNVDDTTPSLYWKSLNHNNQLWLSASFDQPLSSYTHDADIEVLRNILVACYELNPSTKKSGLFFETRLDFDRQWGLGSSSTLIALLADFFKVNPYELLQKTFGGSGYDIAAAFREAPFIYNNTNMLHPEIKPFQFKGEYTHQMYFVYLGKKQNSREAIAHYKKAVGEDPRLIEQMNAIVDLFRQAAKLADLEEAINLHEDFISGQLTLPCAKKLYFNDYWGAVKSLGAWGGDFVLMTNDRGEEVLKQYLKGKGFDTVLTFESMINQTA
jgi:mevalonate kinase